MHAQEQGQRAHGSVRWRTPQYTLTAARSASQAFSPQGAAAESEAELGSKLREDLRLGLRDMQDAAKETGGAALFNPD